MNPIVLVSLLVMAIHFLHAGHTVQPCQERRSL
jgi:hypothetical protein